MKSNRKCVRGEELIKGIVLVFGGVVLSAWGFISMMDNIIVLSTLDLVFIVMLIGFGMFCVMGGIQDIRISKLL